MKRSNDVDVGVGSAETVEDVSHFSRFRVRMLRDPFAYSTLVCHTLFNERRVDEEENQSRGLAGDTFKIARSVADILETVTQSSSQNTTNNVIEYKTVFEIYNHSLNPVAITGVSVLGKDGPKISNVLSSGFIAPGSSTTVEFATTEYVSYFEPHIYFAAKVNVYDESTQPPELLRFALGYQCYRSSSVDILNYIRPVRIIYNTDENDRSSIPLANKGINYGHHGDYPLLNNEYNGGRPMFLQLGWENVPGDLNLNVLAGDISTKYSKELPKINALVNITFL
ncbi:hypothetical protein I5M90_04260 [Serratia marcescens]|uniref:hypothetical protein n=1 Tax=Serratia marcescens TaxID=615 RepID=UPI000B68C242|nr:hypothetical protein [Serratia marcescens]MBH2982589.1 hypothetical protein [Serratia marcescens]MBH3069330.1 hypothetical protein [Serratia marcescens]OUI66832.1 hypothetical protein AZZ99_001096 [Serratia marcescens]HEJ0329399.1 hypothetical protein [Serratia marcescens]